MKNDNFTETYDFLVSVIGNAPYGIIAVDLEGAITMCNNLALDQLGIPFKSKQVIENALTGYTHDIPKLRKKLNQCFNEGRKAFNINNLKVQDKILNIKGRLILNGMIITTSDITEAKETERKIMSAMLEGQENERRRLAREIHDGIGPLMSTIKLNIESVKTELKDASDKTLNKIKNMEDLVQNVAQDIRGISHALMPSAIKDFGLVTALENLSLKTNAAENVNVNFMQSGMNERLSSDIELGLFRITQELLNNAFKYADAKNITIQIVKHPNDLTLTVEDDGKGFDPHNMNQIVDSGIGLRNIKTRTESMKGQFALDSSPGRGVTATVEIPL